MSKRGGGGKGRGEEGRGEEGRERREGERSITIPQVPGRVAGAVQSPGHPVTSPTAHQGC